MPNDQKREKPDIRKCADGKEWRQLEKYYQHATRAIRIPPDLSPRGILKINSQIDRIYGMARFDANYAKAMYDELKEKLMLAKKQANFHFKNLETVGSKSKITADDREVLVITHLETTPLPGMTEPIIPLVERWRKRKIFMDGVIDILMMKQGMMINGNGALKLDAQGRGDWPGKDADDDE